MQTMNRPTTVWTIEEYAQSLDIPPTTVREWQRRGGPLAESARHTFTRGDVLVGLVVLELQHLLGLHSERVYSIIEQIAPRLRTWASTGQVPEVFKLKIGDGPAIVTIDVSPFQLLGNAT